MKNCIRIKNSILPSFSVLFSLALLLTSCYQKPKRSEVFTPGTKFEDLNISPELKSRVKSSRLTAFVFVSAECPICTRCAEDLQGFYETVKKRDVTFYGVFPNSEKSSAMKKWREYYGITFMVYPDANKILSSYFDIKVTPEAVLVDKDAKIVYKGALDNSTKAVVKENNELLEQYLQNAITETLQGNEVTVKNTEPIGCYLERRKR